MKAQILACNFYKNMQKVVIVLLDVGCGSGILSIALAKLGCKVDACDTDEQATQSSLSNAQLNEVKFNKIWTGSIANFRAKI